MQGRRVAYHLLWEHHSLRADLSDERDYLMGDPPLERLCLWLAGPEDRRVKAAQRRLGG